MSSQRETTLPQFADLGRAHEIGFLEAAITSHEKGRREIILVQTIRGSHRTDVTVIHCEYYIASWQGLGEAETTP